MRVAWRFCAVCTIGAVLVAACGSSPRSVPSGAGAGPPLASVTVVPVTTPAERRLDGMVEAINHATVAAQLVAKSDVLAAEVALANAEEEQVSAANAVQVALADYNRLLGEPLDRSPGLDPHLLVEPALVAEPVSALVRQALASRNELKGLAAQSGALAANARAVTAARLPQIALSGGYTHFDNQILDRENFSMVGVGLTWNLFDGGAARNEADALKSESRAADRRLADLRSQIELQVRRDWLAVKAADARVAASREATAQAAENLRISRELYGVGLASNTQVLDAVTLEVQATNNHDNAVLDEALADIELAYAVGAL
jgi:outer membrane protein